jgi:hypothetical protein
MDTHAGKNPRSIGKVAEVLMDTQFKVQGLQKQGGRNVAEVLIDIQVKAQGLHHSASRVAGRWLKCSWIFR